MDELAGKNSLDEAVIYRKNEIRILVKNGADASAVELLKRTVYGTNGVRYQHMGQEDKISQLHNSFFFHLFHNDDLIGIYCLDKRKINVSDSSTISGFYGRYLSIAENHQGKGYGHLMKIEAIRYAEKSTNAPYILYSYIEAKNIRSLRISESEGFTSTATLKTFVFRRYSPKIDSRFAPLLSSEKVSLLYKLTNFYATYRFATFARISYQDNYFVLKEGDEIIAGVQANPVSWKFLDMPGLSGWFMMNILPKFSTTRRFFNPVNYQFLALEGIFIKPGRDDAFSVLLESLLAHFSCNSALLQIDLKDPLTTLLTDTKKMGRLSGFQKNINTYVMMKSVPGDQVFINQDNPVYVSSFDFT